MLSCYSSADADVLVWCVVTLQHCLSLSPLSNGCRGAASGKQVREFSPVYSIDSLFCDPNIAKRPAGPGLDFDVVMVVGMAEGLCPSPRREDTLLPDEQRRLTDGELEQRVNRIHLDHRTFLAAIASGARERVLLLPKGDHRNGRCVAVCAALPSCGRINNLSTCARAGRGGARAAIDRKPHQYSVHSYIFF